MGGNPIERIKVRYSNGIYLCFDGLHRLTAVRQLGYSQIHVTIFNYDDRTAMKESFESNLQRSWTAAEKAMRLLYLYKEGYSIKQIVTQYPTLGVHKTIERYIKYAYYLAPQLLSELGERLHLNCAEIFIGYDSNKQMQVYAWMRSVGRSFTPFTIQEAAGSPPFPRNIKEIVRENIKVDIQSVSDNDRTIESIRGQVKSLLSTGMSREEISSRIFS